MTSKIYGATSTKPSGPLKSPFLSYSKAGWLHPENVSFLGDFQEVPPFAQEFSKLLDLNSGGKTS